MRLPGWELRLAEAVEAARETPFAWGSHDCATWAFGVRAALTGKDATSAWAGLYRSGAGACRVMRRLGWPDIPAMGHALLGAPVPPLTAQRGDIVICEGAFGVCIGVVALFLAPEGLTERPMGDAILAWRI